MGLLKLPIISRVLKVKNAFDLQDSECLFFSILSRFLLLPMCYTPNFKISEEILSNESFVEFLATISADMTVQNFAIVCYKTDRPCFALFSPVFNSVLWAIWHRAPVGRSKLLTGVAPFNDIKWHTDVLQLELGANGPHNACLRLHDFFAVFYEAFSSRPAFRSEVTRIPVDDLALIINKLSWLWSALFQYSISGCVISKESFSESLSKAK